MRIVAANIALAVLLLPLPLAAMEDARAIARISLAAKQQNAMPKAPWMSALRISDDGSDTIRLADGAMLMRRPGEVSSYNSNRVYDVSAFYKPNSVRVGTVMHYAGRKAGEIISVGMDSGYRADKIEIQPALFLGYARSIAASADRYLTFAAGGWVGGKVKHKPCRDSYARQYNCRNLTAWTDFRPQQPKLQRYYHLVYTIAF